MFGLVGPQTAQQDYLKQFTVTPAQMGQMDLLNQVIATGANAGAMAGGSLGRLFGGKTAAEVESEVIKQIMETAAKASPDPLERTKIAAEMFRQKGMEDRAMVLEDRASTLAKTKADTLNQQQGFQMRYAALKKRFPEISDEEARAVANSETAFNNVFKDQQEKLSAFAQQLVDEGLKPGSPEFQSRMRQYNERQASKKSVEEVIGIGLTGLAAAMAGPRAEKAAGAEGTEVGKATAQIGAGYRSLDALRAAIDTVDKGIYAGGYGPLAEAVSKYSSGILGGKDRLVNTEAFRSYIGNVVIPMMSQLGGSDSNEELRKIEEILGANTRLEPEAIKRILVRAEEAVRKDLARIEKQQLAVEQGQRLPTGPIEPKNVPKPTKRFNRETGKFETIGG
jgi:hypothetical protein